jgi:Uncharacterized protein conserved in bacteria (DUF2330)
MSPRTWLVLPFAAACLLAGHATPPSPACCPAPPSGKPVVNADQTVVILWDAASKTEHFIRRASFKSDADDFGFLIPSPTRPDLNESGNDAFPYLQKLTEPEVQVVKRPTGGGGCGCGDTGTTKKSTGATAMMAAKAEVRVLQEKEVAGFNAAVLEADSATVLVKWLEEHGYAFSPAIEAWAKPYVEAKWKITALKVAKPKEGADTKAVTAAALRMTFQTDRPLFPYREPDSASAAAALGANHRLLRIYFLSDARYQGELTPESPWTGRVAWAGKLAEANRKRTLELLNLPETTGPTDCWLTEFEDPWPYRVAPADLYFTRSSDQTTVKRPPIIQYVASPWPADGAAYALAAVVVGPPLIRRIRRRDYLAPRH